MQRTFRRVSLGSRYLSAGLAVVIPTVGILAGCGSAAEAGSTAPVTAVSTGPTPRFGTPMPASGSSSAAATSKASAGTSAATPTIPADVPLTGHNMVAGEKPPVEPAAALAHTQDGAIAFAKFWVQVMDWGYATTSTAYARHYADPICSNCFTTLNNIDSFAAKGDRYLGGRTTIVGVLPDNSYPASNGSEYVVKITANITGLEVVDSQQKFVGGEAPADGQQFRVWLAQKAGAWTVVNFGAR